MAAAVAPAVPRRLVKHISYFEASEMGKSELFERASATVHKEYGIPYSEEEILEQEIRTSDLFWEHMATCASL